MESDEYEGQASREGINGEVVINVTAYKDNRVVGKRVIEIHADEHSMYSGVLKK